MYTNWEQDGVNNSGCVVPDLPADGSAPPPVETQCVLGGMSAYVVNATCADAIATAVKFAAQYNLRFRIKNVAEPFTIAHTHDTDQIHFRVATTTLDAHPVLALYLSGPST